MGDLIEYQKVRPQIKTGDPILCHGYSLLDLGIQIKTGYWNHAQCAIRLEEFKGMIDRIFVEEALSPGLELNFLSRELESYDGKASWFPLLPAFDDELRNDIAAFALPEQGKPYAVRDMLSQLFERTTIAEINGDDVSIIVPDKYFCSESWFIFVAKTTQDHKDRCPEAWALVKAAVIKLNGNAPWPNECDKLGLTGEGKAIL